jgi:indole-3-acetate O-methyltransferase
MERVKSLENVLAMNGGDGDTSYARVSLSVQLRTIQVIKPILEREISQYMSSDNLKGGDGVFRIADLGCATGTNTLLVADTIVRAVQTTCSSHSIEVPEFQVYFADLPSNDFNSLLRSLPPHERLADRTHKEDEDESCFSQPPATRSYFAAVVSGTFYKRLFPPKSLHFCHTCSSLLWLSQVPDSVVDRNSPAWNGGAIYISRDEVGAAYLSQFLKDFSAFLAARAEEMVPGGCMFVSLTARKSADLKEQGAIGHISHYMEAAFEELIKEGVIEKEKVDSFNLPLFCPNVEELESIVKMEESFEIVDSVKLFSGLPLHPISEVSKGDEEMFGRMVTNSYRAAFENLVRAQLDSDVLTNEFYLRIEKMATAKCQEYLRHRGDQLVAFLVRK